MVQAEQYPASSSKVLMLENAIYSVISPEGCATTLERSKKMLNAVGNEIVANDLYELKLTELLKNLWAVLIEIKI